VNYRRCQAENATRRFKSAGSWRAAPSRGRRIGSSRRLNDSIGPFRRQRRPGERGDINRISFGIALQARHTAKKAGRSGRGTVQIRRECRLFACAKGEARLIRWIMQTLLADYLPLVLFIGLSLVIGLALLVAPFAVAYQNPDPEKVSAYECGFNAFDDARMKFDVRFYLVAILFIIFDLEVAFLFPWAVALKDVGAFGFWSMMVFLGVLTIGFIYEWRKGALEWD
jgi:NADH-quinone oxidoreductase subunit A